MRDPDWEGSATSGADEVRRGSAASGYRSKGRARSARLSRGDATPACSDGCGDCGVTGGGCVSAFAFSAFDESGNVSRLEGLSSALSGGVLLLGTFRAFSCGLRGSGRCDSAMMREGLLAGFSGRAWFAGR